MDWGSKQAIRGMVWAVVMGLSGCSYDFVKTDAHPAPQTASTPSSEPTDVASTPAQNTSAATPNASSGDVWERLSARFRYSGIEHASVRKELQWFEAQPKVLERSSRSAAPYLYFVAAELERRDMPAELALLPILESGYQPGIKSPNGAAGLWQFMRDTGARLSLPRSKWYDGRKDVVASTRAALDYLAALHERFDRDWLTAIAAYNAGWGNVERAVEMNRRRGRPTDFWALDLKPETRQLVARTLALAELVRHDGPLRKAFQAIPDRPYFAEITLDKPADLRALTAQAGISEDDFKTLNPAFRTWHTGPVSGRISLLVPVAAVEPASRAVAALMPNEDFPKLADDADEKRAVAATTLVYTVHSGDSVWTIANRHKVKVADLISLNNLAKKPKLKLGQKLSIPGGKAHDDNEKLAADAKPAAKTLAAAPKTAKAQRAQVVNNDVVHYRVQEGDSLWTISRRFKVTIEQLLSWNNLEHTQQLQPGQDILVYSPT
jgi:membrane-bound lytic murein transglycosylase D